MSGLGYACSGVVSKVTGVKATTGDLTIEARCENGKKAALDAISKAFR